MPPESERGTGAALGILRNKLRRQWLRMGDNAKKDALLWRQCGEELAVVVCNARRRGRRQRMHHAGIDIDVDDRARYPRSLPNPARRNRRVDDCWALQQHAAIAEAAVHALQHLRRQFLRLLQMPQV
jgi:hypothetical protein